MRKSVVTRKKIRDEELKKSVTRPRTRSEGRHTRRNTKGRTRMSSKTTLMRMFTKTEWSIVIGMSFLITTMSTIVCLRAFTILVTRTWTSATTKMRRRIRVTRIRSCRRPQTRSQLPASRKRTSSVTIISMASDTSSNTQSELRPTMM